MSALATDAGRQPVSMGVLAAGACSGRRCRQLGHEMPLESERDYNVAFATPGASTRIQAMWRRRVSVASPLEMGMRFAETVELAGLKAPPDERRATVLLRHSETMILGRRVDQVSRRMVHRPGTPESIPVINPSPHRSLLRRPLCRNRSAAMSRLSQALQVDSAAQSPNCSLRAAPRSPRPT